LEPLSDFRASKKTVVRTKFEIQSLTRGLRASSFYKDIAAPAKLIEDGGPTRALKDVVPLRPSARRNARRSRDFTVSGAEA
jgi:hypothetical protein